MLLRREGERVPTSACPAPARPTGSSRPIASGSSMSSSGVHLEPVEERPPDRLALAVVVVEELGGELVARRRAAPRAAPPARACSGRDLLRLLRLGRRERPELRRAPRPAARAASRAARGSRCSPRVVGGDRVEDRLVARLHLPLVLDDRGAAVLDLGAVASKSRNTSISFSP